MCFGMPVHPPDLPIQPKAAVDAELAVPGSKSLTNRALLVAARLYPSALRFVHARPGAPATRFLVHAVRDRQPGLVVRPPLVVHAERGGYAPEGAAWVGPTGGAPLPG